MMNNKAIEINPKDTEEICSIIKSLLKNLKMNKT